MVELGPNVVFVEESLWYLDFNDGGWAADLPLLLKFNIGVFERFNSCGISNRLVRHPRAMLVGKYPFV